MPMLPPVSMTIDQLVEESNKARAEIARTAVRPTDYQIRHDALRLAVQAAAADKSILTPGVFSEWQTFFEQALRLAL